ncbi:MAG: cation:proton antiporter [Gemmatimonadota bacterium]
MSPLLGTLILILLALLGARFSFSTERVRARPRLFLRTGTYFLIFGYALGPAGLALLDLTATQQLFPFLALALGWFGFHFGLQLNLENLRHFPFRHHLLGIGQAVLAFGIFLGLGTLALTGLARAGMDVDGPVARTLLLCAAAAASVSTPAGIAAVSSNYLVRGPVRDLLFFTASLDAGVGILALQVVYALYRPEGMGAAVGVTGDLSLLGVAVGLGLVFGMLFLWLTRGRTPGEELVLYLLGMCAFAAGAALQWGLSPLFVSLVAGALVANLNPERGRIFALLERWEKPVYLIFLLVAGALLDAPTPAVLGLALAYTVLRALSKGAAAAVMVTAVPLSFRVPRRLGLGLIPQGGIALAMALSVVLTYSGLQIGGVDGERAFFTVIVIGVLLSEVVGPYLTAHLLRRAGEISPGVEEALAQGDRRQAEREAVGPRPEVL